MLQTLVKVLPSLWSKSCLDLRLSFPFSCGIAELIDHNTPSSKLILTGIIRTIEGGFVKAVSSDWMSSKVKIEVPSQSQRIMKHLSTC